MQRERDTKPHTRSPSPILAHLRGALGKYGRGERVWPGRDHDRHPRRDRLDWASLKDRIEMGRVATELLGEPQKVGGSGRMWWLCPFHPDRNPSFCVTPGFSVWKCFGCGVRGDAVDLVMKLRGVIFVEAIFCLKEMYGWVRPPSQGNGVCWAGRSGPPTRSAGAIPRPSPVVSGHPTGLPVSEARMLVEEARQRLWSPEGLRERQWLHDRGLSDATIRAAGLGWTPRVMVPTRDEIRYFRAGGIVLPWFDGDRLAMVKIRQPADRQPKYVEAFRDAPRVYPSPATVRSGAPLILAEGEFDALLLAQELGDDGLGRDRGIGLGLLRRPGLVPADGARSMPPTTPTTPGTAPRRPVRGGRSASGPRPRTRTGPTPPAPG